MEDWRKQVTETETPGENGGPPELASKHNASRTEEAYIRSLLERHFDPGQSSSLGNIGGITSVCESNA